MNILLIEDHVDTARAMEFSLKRRGGRVTKAATVAEAFKALKADAFDVILLDLRLPDGHGAEVLEFHRENGLPGRVAIVTGDFGPLLDDANALHPDAQFLKPVNLDQLWEWATAKVEK